MEEKINDILNKIRPFLQNDGGDVEFIKFEEGIVYVTMHGACSGCPMMAMTLNNTIKTSIINEIPEVIDVVNIQQ